MEALIEPDAMQRLADIASEVTMDQAIVEVGVHHAVNLCSMAQAAKDGGNATVYGVDAYGTGHVYVGRPHMLTRYTNADHQQAIANIKAQHLVRQTRVIVATSTDAAATYDGPPVALLVIDAEHRYHSTLADYQAWAPHLAPHALIAFDDYGGHYGTEVKQAVDQLIEDGHLEAVELAGTRLLITRETECRAKATPTTADTTTDTMHSAPDGHPEYEPAPSDAPDAENPSDPTNPGTSDTSTAPSTPPTHSGADPNTAAATAQPPAAAECHHASR